MSLLNLNHKELTDEPEYISVNRRAYDQLSHEYQRRSLQKSPFETPASEIIDTMIQTKAIGGSSAVLEIGPGSGEAAAYFASLNCRTVAVDISAEIIKVARKNSPTTEFILSDILQADFEEYTFDIIFAGALIHLFPASDAEKLLSIIKTWMKTDGRLFISTTIHSKSEEGYLVKSDYQGKIKRFRKKWTEGEFKSFLEKSFEILNTLYTDEVDRNKKWVGHICRKKNYE